MKHLFLTVLLVMLVVSALNDQTSVPQVTEEMIEQALTEYSEIHPKAKSVPPKTFTTDGCTLFPDSFFGIVSWKNICIEHDIVYWGGGSKSLRDEADKRLKEDANKVMNGLGDMMSLAARIGGTPSLPTPWRWGYGWSTTRGYTAD